MRKDDIFEAMETIDPALVEDAAIDAAPGGGRRIFTRTVQIGLAAAAVAALTVTALAVTPLYRGDGGSDNVAEGPVNEFGSKTKLITTEGYSREFFDEDIQKLIDYTVRENEAQAAGETFTESEPDIAQPADWDEVEQMLGIDLLDSDVLDAAPVASNRANRGEGPEEGYYFRCYYDDGACGIYAYREQYVDGVNVQLIAKVFLGEDGTVERQVPYYPDSRPYSEIYDHPEPVGCTVTMKTGKTIEFDDYGANYGWNQFNFLESGVDYFIIFKSALWDDLEAVGYTHPDPIDYDGVVVKVLESLGFEEEA